MLRRRAKCETYNSEKFTIFYELKKTKSRIIYCSVTGLHRRSNRTNYRWSKSLIHAFDWYVLLTDRFIATVGVGTARYRPTLNKYANLMNKTSTSVIIARRNAGGQTARLRCCHGHQPVARLVLLLMLLRWTTRTCKLDYDHRHRSANGIVTGQAIKRPKSASRPWWKSMT